MEKPNDQTPTAERRIGRFPVPWKETDQAYREMDHLVVMGTVVSHDTNRKPNHRKFQTVERNIFPTHLPRDKWRKDLDAVGAAWTEKGEKGKLHGRDRSSCTRNANFPLVIEMVPKGGLDRVSLGDLAIGRNGAATG